MKIGKYFIMIKISGVLELRNAYGLQGGMFKRENPNLVNPPQGLIQMNLLACVVKYIKLMSIFSIKTYKIYL